VFINIKNTIYGGVCIMVAPDIVLRKKGELPHKAIPISIPYRFRQGKIRNREMGIVSCKPTKLD
jgi:hypothetical protein